MKAFKLTTKELARFKASADKHYAGEAVRSGVVMDRVTKRLRESIKPIANEPLLAVDDPPVPEKEKQAWASAFLRAQAFARRFLSETARDGAEERS